MNGNEQEPIQPSAPRPRAKKKRLSLGAKLWIGVAVVIMLIVIGAMNQEGSNSTSDTGKAGDSTSQPSASASASDTASALPHTLTGITVSYSGNRADGTAINDQTQGISVTANYADGVKEFPTGWKVNNPGALSMSGPQDFVIEYQGQQAKLTLQADVPPEYQSALAKAGQYSDSMQMSKQGIYDQLTSQYGEQFSAQAAQYAVDNLKADYNANALAKAKSYQSQMNMSPGAIHDQLTSRYGEQFTQSEADYAIAHLND